MNRPGIGIGIYILKGNKILMGKRQSRHGTGTWCPPGGHMEFGESIKKCAIREAAEEAGVQIHKIKFGPYTNDIYLDEKKHYITLAIIADYKSGEPKILEPDKINQWDWFTWDNLPQPLFLPVQNAIDQGFNPWNFWKQIDSPA